MSPDKSEWIEVVQLMRALWPHSEIPDATISAWYEAVSDLPKDQVVVAVTAIGREGREFAPTGGMIRKWVLEARDDAPQWGPVWRAIFKAQAKAPALPDSPDLRADWLTENGFPLAAEFMEHIGWPPAEEWNEDNLESRLRRKWEEWLRDRAEGRILKGLPSVALARLERSNSSTGLHKLTSLTDRRSLEEGETPDTAA